MLKKTFGKVVEKGFSFGKSIVENKTKRIMQPLKQKHERYLKGLEYRKKFGSQILFFWISGIFAFLFSVMVFAPILVKIFPSLSGLIKEYIEIYSAIGHKVVVSVLGAILGIDKLSSFAENKLSSTIKKTLIEKKSDEKKEKMKQDADVEKEKIKKGVVGDDFVSLKVNPKSIKKVKEFVNKFAPSAIKTETNFGLPASAVLAHAALETGWGRHILKGWDENKNRIETNNIFNIKNSSDWKGKTAFKRVWEVNDKGEDIEQDSLFKVYDNYDDAFLDYAKLITERERYEEADKADDPEEYAKALYKCGYMTDPDAPEKIIKIMKKHFIYTT